VLTVNTETGETACVLHLKIPQRIHPWRDTVKGKDREKQEKEEGGPYPPSPRLLEGILVPLVWVLSYGCTCTCTWIMPDIQRGFSTGFSILYRNSEE
jgi:hypothetical protein